MTLLSTLLLAAAALATPPQSENDDETQLLQLYENTSDDQEDINAAHENITELLRQPLDINTASCDELLMIPGLDRETADHIVNHRLVYGDFHSLEELHLVEGVSQQLWQLLAAVTRVDNSDDLPWYSRQRLGESIRHAQQQITFSATQPLYYRAGDMHAPQTVEGEENSYAGTYRGGRMRHSLRYSLDVGTNISANITGANSQGEPFFRAGNSQGYDAYAWNISVRQLRHLRHLIVGHYRAQFGMGLILNNNFSLGKQAMTASAARSATAFTPHSSASDSRHLQGAAATLSFGAFDIAAFASYRHIDATLNADSTISTILTDGYHRTANEMAKKNNASQTTAGVHAGYSHRTHGGTEYSLGINGLFTSLNRPLNPTYSSDGTISDSRQYRRYYPSGRDFYNVSADYRLAWRSISITGETAINDIGAVATINTLLFSGIKRLTLHLTQRFYAYNYYSLYSSAMSEGGAVQNESAVLLGARWTPSRTLTVEGYTDVAYFPWLRYRVSTASMAWDNTLSITKSLNKWQLTARYRMKLRQQDKTISDSDGNSTKVLADKVTHRLRLTAAYKGMQWSSRSNVEGIWLNKGSRGIIASQSVRYTPFRALKLYASGIVFSTDDYDSRLYAYEQGLLYTFSNASYYGDGVRLAFMCTCSPTRWLQLRGKIGYTNYFDRDNISSAERMIFGSHATDIDMQAIVKL